MVLITEWDQFRALDFDRVKKLLKSPVRGRLRNVYQPSDMQRRGFNYTSVGPLAAKLYNNAKGAIDRRVDDTS
jgi:hypothetical protein